MIPTPPTPSLTNPTDTPLYFKTMLSTNVDPELIRERTYSPRPYDVDQALADIRARQANSRP